MHCFAGVLGKRTRFQQRDISQLMLEVKCDGSTQPWASAEATSIPKVCQYRITLG